jgi:hypothetical protein
MRFRPPLFPESLKYSAAVTRFMQNEMMHTVPHGSGSKAAGMPSCMPLFGNSSTLLKRGCAYLVRGEAAVAGRILHSAVFRAMSFSEGTVLWVDGGNTFNPYTITGLSERCGSDTEEILSRIRVARAFTAHQMNAIALSALEEAKKGTVCFLAVSSLPDLFISDVRWREGMQLLGSTLKTFRELAGMHNCWSVMTAGSGVHDGSGIEKIFAANFESVVDVGYSGGRLETDAMDRFTSMRRWNLHEYQRSLFDFCGGDD